MDIKYNATISIIGGAGYQANLKWIPRVGDLIDFWSALDANNTPSNGQYYLEVVQVVHYFHDTTEQFPPTEDSHNVHIITKRTTSQYFNA
jgi:hypothetical protein